MLCKLFYSFVLLLLVALAPPAGAHDITQGDIQVIHPWARATAGAAANGAVYMVISEEGEAPDRLLGASTPVADKVGLHSSRMEEGIMKMRPIDALDLQPGSPVVLEPGGLHLMLFGLKAPLVEGERFLLTLTFERAGDLTLEVMVEPLGVLKTPSHDDHGN